MHKKLVVRAIVTEDNSFCLGHDHLVAARHQRGVSSMTMPALTTTVVLPAIGGRWPHGCGLRPAATAGVLPLRARRPTMSVRLRLG